MLVQISIVAHGLTSPNGSGGISASCSNRRKLQPTGRYTSRGRWRRERLYRTITVFECPISAKICIPLSNKCSIMISCRRCKIFYQDVYISFCYTSEAGIVIDEIVDITCQFYRGLCYLEASLGNITRGTRKSTLQSCPCRVDILCTTSCYRGCRPGVSLSGSGSFVG